MQVQTHRLPTRWLTTVATLVIALTLSACINSQTAVPGPAATPEPEGTATPAPTPEETRPPEPGPSEQDTALPLQETYNALSGPEQECIQDQLGEENLEIFLRTPVGGLYDHPEQWQPAAIFGCLKRETANDLFMAFVQTDPQASEAVRACVRNLLEEIDIAKAAWGFLESATDEQITQATMLLIGLQACFEDHGPSADSPEPPGPPPPEHALLWEFKMPDTGDFPMIAATITGGTLFIASRPGQVYALEAETGKVRWHTELDAEFYPPPVVRDSKIYVDSISDYYTLDANTGEVLETNEGQGPRHTDPPDPETGRTYRLEGGLPPGTRVHAVDAATGTRVWTYDVGSIVPVAPTQSGGTVFVRSYEGVHALDESTGKLLWETEWEYVGDYPSHIVDGIWPVAGDGTLTALDARTGKRLWSFEEDRINHIAGAADGMVLAAGNLGFYGIEAATGQKKWSLNKDWGVFYVTVADGVIYANVLTGDLHTLDLQTGEPLWTQRIGYYLGPEYGLYRVVDGVVYVTHREGVRAYRAPAATGTRPPAATRAPAPTPAPTPTAISSNTDRVALVALYNATDGANWLKSANWLTDEPLIFWHGVETDSTGSVISLNLEDNQLSGELPPELGNLTNLTKLGLDGNRLTGTIPPELGRLTNLTILWLDHNQLSGTIPPELGLLSNLELLELARNRLTGAIPPELGNLTNLVWLGLAVNQLTGAIPPELGRLSNLEKLHIFMNPISGTIPPELGNLTNLTSLWLVGNRLTGTIPPELARLTNLEGLSLENNQLSGTIPPELGSLTNLTKLGLHGNRLTGTLPPELGNLTNLTRLRLTYNQLTGAIPPELGRLSNLTELSLDNNQLKGTIPPELGNLTNLTSLWLVGNRLTGTIPPELARLTNLEGLSLENNQLSGTIPPELGNLTNLRWLYLAPNHLTGCIPAGLRNLDRNDLADLGLPDCG